MAINVGYTECFLESCRLMILAPSTAANSGNTVSQAPRPRLVAKSASGHQTSAPKLMNSLAKNGTGAGPDPNQVWNRNRREARPHDACSPSIDIALQLLRRRHLNSLQTRSLSNSMVYILPLVYKQMEMGRRRSGLILTTMKTTGYPKQLNGTMAQRSISHILTPRLFLQRKKRRRRLQQKKRKRRRKQNYLPRNLPPALDLMRQS